MADIAVIILQVVAEIHDIASDIKENDRQARRLFERVTAVEPAVFAVKQGRRVVSSSESLLQLSSAVKDIRVFLGEYARTSKVNRALNRKSNAAKFSRLGALLTEGMHALQLNVSVDDWAREDASDRLEDLENFIDMMERMERQRTQNHAEVIGNQAEQMGVLKDVLKTLRKDERSELTESFEINFEKDLDFEDSARLGFGGFGEVRTAKWNGVDVAVKQLLPGRLTRNDIRALRKEVRIHSDLRFAHVVQLYAAATVAPNLCLVTELASGGSLQKCLHSTTEPLPHALQTGFLFDIARGMSFLHSRGILHRDLKSANVLMFDNARLKLCDFGLSKIKTESSISGGAAGTVPWMAPEVMSENPANELTDVYSFGVVSFEVATRAQPFKGLSAPQVITGVVLSKKRPQIPEWASASPDVVRLMERCWEQNPAERPEGFGPVVRTLAGVVSRVGDPRMRTDSTGSSGAKHDATQSAGVPTAPVTASGGVETSPLERVVAKEPLATAAGSVEKLDGVQRVQNVGVYGAAAAVDDSSGAERDGAPSYGVRVQPPAYGNVVNVAPAHSGNVKTAPPAYSGGGKTSPPESMSTTEPPKEAGPKKSSARAPPALPARPAAGYQQVRALFSYTAADHSELSLNEGEVLKLVSQDKGGWWTGEKGGRKGVFPSNYVQLLPKLPAAPPLPDRKPPTDVGGTTHDPADLDAATDLRHQADKLTEQSKLSEADQLYITAIKLQEKAHGADHLDLAATLNNRGELLLLTADEAEPLCRRSLDIREKALGPDHLDVAESLKTLADALLGQDKNDEAWPLFERSLGIREKALGPGHPDVASVLDNQAWILTEQGKLEEAGSLCDRAMRIREETQGRDHPDVAETLLSRGELLKKLGKHEAAGRVYERCVAIVENALGPHHILIALPLVQHASLLFEQEKRDELYPLLVRSMEIFRKSVGPYHPEVGALLVFHANVLRCQGKNAEADPLYLRAIEVGEHAFDPDNPKLAKWLQGRAKGLDGQNKYEEAEPLHRRAIAIREKVLGSEHPDVVKSLTDWGTALHDRAEWLREQGKFAEAEPVYERCRRVREEVLGPEHSHVGLTLGRWAMCLNSQGKIEEAGRLFHRACEIAEKATGEDEYLGHALACRARLLEVQGKHKEALPVRERAHSIFKKNLGAKHPDTVKAKDSVKAARKMAGKKSWF